jgi:Ca-activated chloride channel family protein
MTSEERESRLTAYALNDAGVSANERQEIETLLAGDPAARQAVEEARQFAKVLSEGLAAEQAAMPAPKGVTIPTPEPTNRKTPARWPQFIAAAMVLIAVGSVTAIVWSKYKAEADRDRRDRAVLVARTGANESDPSMGGEGLREETRFRTNRMTEEQMALSGAGTEGAAALGSKPQFGGGGVGGGGYGGPARGAAGPGMPGGPGTQTIPGPGGPPVALPAAPALPGLAPPGDIPRDSKSDRRVPTPVAPPASTAPRKGGEPRDGSRSKGDDAAPRGEGEKGAAKADKGDPKPSEAPPVVSDPVGADRHPQLIENPFIKVDQLNALSTFGVDVDTASYSIVRKYLSEGQLPPVDAVRLEEMVNYFPYADKPPEGDDPFAVTVEMAECPWQPAHRLVRLGLKAKPIPNEKRPPSNLVFLIDVSGSMMTPERLPLVKASLKLLVAQLREKDQVAMVAYAGNSGLVLDSTTGVQKDRIVEALDRLEAGGSTAGSQGIEQAYEVAEKHFIKNGTNRVILCTDGDWNVGVTSTDALVKLIEKKRESGVYLSVFGFGFGNLRDEMLSKLSGKGNGNYAYVDSLKEGHKVFVEQLGGTLVTVAKDVKVQVEFNPAVIKSYRLLGYEKRILAAKDFHDDKVDAGEMGAGHVVTALYELVPIGAPDPVVGKVDKLRYQKEPDTKPVVKSELKDEAFLVKMRHKKPDSDTSTLREMPVKDVTKEYAKASEDFQFSAAVAGFAMLLRDSQYKGSANYGLVLELAQSAMTHDPSGYRAEFVELVKKAKSLAGK